MEEIIKQILTNQQVIMMCLYEEHEEYDAILSYESRKTSDLLINHKNFNSIINSMYGITASQYKDYKNYRKKVINKIEEERKKFLEKGKNAIDVKEKLLYNDIIEFLARLEFEI